MSGIGTIDNPWSLEQVLSIPGLVKAGDLVYLRGGTYSGDVICSLNGSTNAQITFRAYPGERPILNGNFSFSGSYVTWWGIEFTGAFEDRSAANGTDLTVGGNGNKLVNCIVHDKTNGISGGNTSDNYELYGNIIYHNGYDSALGHGAYIQHSDTVGRAIVKRNIMFNNFAYGFHIYGNPPVNNFTLDKNISFHNGSPREIPMLNYLVGGYAGGDGSIVTNNRGFHQMAEAENMRVGWGIGNQVTNATITGNFLAGATSGLYLTDVITPTVTGNYIYGTLLQNNGGVQSDASETYPDNTLGASDAWGDTVFVDDNEYDENRAHITIYNKSAADSVTVDVSAVFTAGDVLTVRNVQDYWNDTQELTVSEAGAIVVDMRASERTVAAPVGWIAPATTFPTFGCFVAE